MEQEYKRRLKDDFGIVFNELYTITNMPIKRFLHQLERDGRLKEYMTLLANSFNPKATENVMCRDLVSVSWQGELFDCDFNQMLELPIAGERKTIWDIESLVEIEQESIAFADHCYGCTAGSGSSCGGTIA